MDTKIKEFKEANKIEKDKKYDFACVMGEITVSKDEWGTIVSSISPEDLYNPEGTQQRYGIDNETHVTLLYGLHKDINDVKLINYIRTLKHFIVTVGSISLFENDEFDVLKFDLTSVELFDINTHLKNSFEYTSSFPDYKPHMTIAYLQKGKGAMYCEKLKSDGCDTDKQFIVNKIEYSKTNGTKYYISLINN